MVRAHQHAGGARHQPPVYFAVEVLAPTELDTWAGSNFKKSSGKPSRETLGRSAGRLPGSPLQGTATTHWRSNRSCRGSGSVAAVVAARRPPRADAGWQGVPRRAGPLPALPSDGLVRKGGS